jgi:hypothetical protein
MKFIILKTSPTGRKLQALVKKMDAALQAQRAFARKAGAQTFRGIWSPAIAGGISSLQFADGKSPDKTEWKNVYNSRSEWMPKRNTKFGKAMYSEIAKLPVVHNDELNAIVGFHDSGFSCVGLDMSNNKKYFGIVAAEKWGIKPTRDMKEVTVSAYNKLFKEKKK